MPLTPRKSFLMNVVLPTPGSPVMRRFFFTKPNGALLSFYLSSAPSSLETGTSETVSSGTVSSGEEDFMLSVTS